MGFPDKKKITEPWERII